MRACPRELVRESPFARARAREPVRERPLREPSASPLREPLCESPFRWVAGGSWVGCGLRAHPRELVRESPSVRACSREPVRERSLREPSARALCESPSARASPREPLRVGRGWVAKPVRESLSARAPSARASPREPHRVSHGWVAGGSQGSESLSARALPREPLRVGRGWVAGEREQQQEQQEQLFRTAQPPTNALRDFLLRSGTPSL